MVAAKQNAHSHSIHYSHSINSVTFSPNGQTVVSASKRILLWGFDTNLRWSKERHQDFLSNSKISKERLYFLLCVHKRLCGHFAMPIELWYEILSFVFEFRVS